MPQSSLTIQPSTSRSLNSDMNIETSKFRDQHASFAHAPMHAQAHAHARTGACAHAAHMRAQARKNAGVPKSDNAQSPPLYYACISICMHDSQMTCPPCSLCLVFHLRCCCLPLRGFVLARGCAVRIGLHPEHVQVLGRFSGQSCGLR